MQISRTPFFCGVLETGEAAALSFQSVTYEEGTIPSFRFGCGLGPQKNMPWSFAPQKQSTPNKRPFSNHHMISRVSFHLYVVQLSSVAPRLCKSV